MYLDYVMFKFVWKYYHKAHEYEQKAQVNQTQQKEKKGTFCVPEEGREYIRYNNENNNACMNL